MFSNKENVKLVKTFVSDIKSTGVVCRNDVIALEEQIEGIVSDEISLNNFTSIKTSTGIESLIKHFDNLLLSVEEEKVLSITVFIKELYMLRTLATSILRGLNKIEEFDYDLLINARDNNSLSFYTGSGLDRTLVNPMDLSINEFISSINRFKEVMLSNKKEVVYNEITEYILSLEVLLETTTLQTYPLINHVLNNKLSLYNTPTEFSDYTVGDVVTKLILNKGLSTKIEELIKDCTSKIHSATFDVQYDMNMTNTDHTFTYKCNLDGIMNVKSLLNDGASLTFIMLLKIIFSK